MCVRQQLLSEFKHHYDFFGFITPNIYHHKHTKRPIPCCQHRLQVSEYSSALSCMLPALCWFLSSASYVISTSLLALVNRLRSLAL